MNKCIYNFATVCLGSSDPYHIVSYYMEWVTTSWTYSTYSSHDKLFLRNTPPSWIYSCARACVHYALCTHAKLTGSNTFQLFPSYVQKVCSVILACELGLLY